MMKNCAILHNGVSMPMLGLGTYRMEDGAATIQTIQRALDLGYRHIDTASFYRNERSVGKAIRESNVARDEIFLTTKVWNADQGYDATLHAFDVSMKKLGLDTLDLYLIHWPVPALYTETWRALVRLYREKRVRAVGVSNFNIHHIEDLLAAGEMTPMVNQVEFHPRLAQPELLDFCKTHKIQMVAWCPLMRGKVDKIPALKNLAKKYDRTPAQIVLRWDNQMGVAAIPKTTHETRMKENLEALDFSLTPDDMLTIARLDTGSRLNPRQDPDHFDF